MLKKFLFVAITILLFSLPCLGSDVKPLSLDECLTIAVNNNSDIQTGRNNTAAAASKIVSAKSSYLPQVSLQNTTFSWNNNSLYNSQSTGTSVAVSQNLYDSGLREAKVRAAKYSADSSEAELRRTIQTIYYNVKKYYFELLRARHLAEVSAANVTYNQGLLDQIMEQVKVGSAAEVDKLPVEAQLASAKVSLLSAQNTVRSSLIKLQNSMGLQIMPGFDIQDVTITVDNNISDLDTYVESALKNRPDIIQNRSAIDVAKANTSIAKIALSPQPNISAEYFKNVAGNTGRNNTQIVGSITFDLFDGGANRAAYKEARLNQENVQLQEQQLIKDIRADVEDAHLNLTNAKERISASIISYDAAKRNYESQKEQYSQGLSTTLDLLNAEVQMVSAQVDDVQAHYDYYIALAQIDYVVGR